MDAYQTDLARTFYLRGERLCDTCSRCEIRSLCGAGNLPNRYSSQNQFDNPSVFCEDLIKLITHVQRTVHAALPATVLPRLKVPLVDPEVVAANARRPSRRRISLPLLAAGPG